MSQEVFQHTFANGLTLLAERMPHVRSAAFSISVRAGCAYEDEKTRGLAGVLLDLMTRGAGQRDNRAVNLALDSLGVDRSESAGTMTLYLGGATLARNLAATLEIYADILRRPHLPAAELEPARSLAIQDIQGLDDEPQSKVMVELRKRHYPDPLGRDHRGTEEGVKAVTIEAVKKFYQRHVQPDGLILSVAGDLEWNALKEQTEKLFGDWKAAPVPEPKPRAEKPKGDHLSKELDQTQIGIAYSSVPMSDPNFYAARGAVGVLSEGMSSRLFTEVREKYGLCYAIGARYETLRDRGSVICYTAGRPEKAQELLDRTLHELKRLADGVEEEELARVKAGLKSALIMRQESTSARAGSNSSDWFLLGRVRPLGEIQAAVDALTPGRIVEHVRKFPAIDFTIVTLGPAALKYQTRE
ncbi:MAG: M16 family metallopeptidase [Gemmataceae bacterium]